MNWCQEQRLLWIKDVIEIFGFVNRGHVAKKFKISEAQVAVDFRIFLKKYPDLMHYNPTNKRYERL